MAASRPYEGDWPLGMDDTDGSGKAGVSLPVDEVFRERYNFILKSNVWAVHERVRVSRINTLIQLFLILALYDALNSLASEHVSRDQYDIELNRCGEDECIPALQAELAGGGLAAVRRAYWWLCAAVVVAMVVLDLARYTRRSLSATAVVDAVLGFTTAERERRRPRCFLLLCIPAVHTLYTFAQPLVAPCGCVGTAKSAFVWRQVHRVFALGFVSAYTLLYDAHNNGYFILRLGNEDRCSATVLRSRGGMRAGTSRLTARSSSVAVAGGRGIAGGGVGAVGVAGVASIAGGARASGGSSGGDVLRGNDLLGPGRSSAAASDGAVRV